MILKIRFYLILFILTIGIVIALMKAGNTQLVQGSSLEHLLQRQYTRTAEYSGFRGDILDRNGYLLATSIYTDSLYAEPKKISNPDRIANFLSTEINLDKQQIDKLFSNKSFVWLKRRIDPISARKIRNLNTKGIGLLQEEQRFYPNYGLFGQSLGFVTSDGIALGGVEQSFDSNLKSGIMHASFYQDAKGNRINNNFYPKIENFHGKNILLTIDRNIQSVAESALFKAIETHQAKSGWAIVMNPKTGEILAMANVPLMNPNSPSYKDMHARRNNVIARAGEPGSTFKIVTFAAGYELGLINSKEKINCENGEWDLGYMTIKDIAKRKWLTPAQIFKYSSNIGTFKIAERIGMNRFYQIIKRFGYGESPGLNLAEEARGYVSKPETWHRTRFANISFGYGIMATPLQMAIMVSTIANGGIRVPPRILKGIKIGHDLIKKPSEDKKRLRIIKEESAFAITKMMIEDTVKDGTGRRAAIRGVLVAGKTGTVEKVSPSGIYDKNANISSFVGFAPANDPQIVALVSIDEPKGIAYGGYIAAPVWKEIVESALFRVNP